MANTNSGLPETPPRDCLVEREETLAEAFRRDEWVEHIDTIYIPMKLGATLWVGLVINFNLSLIEVLDPDCATFDTRAIEAALQPISHSLPYILKSYCMTRNSSKMDVKPFAVKRASGLYQNNRGGDSGPVAVKFLEIHAHGNPFECSTSITDDLVDQLRKQFVLDTCATYLYPVYSHRYLSRSL